MKFFKWFLLILMLSMVSAVYGQKKYTWESVDGDPMKVRLYTLDNGLKVYLSVYKDKPRIMTAIAVRTGSKNDPPDNTGLSHYLEHMMFKGTEHFGTRDYASERVYLDKIDSLFEVYRGQTDPSVRLATYKMIDSISGLAAKWAIANEYDKMMGMIGAKGTNAFTSSEMTVYINDIPSNQVENWLTVEADRFMYPVFRIFHTELETVYEEKNMSLDSDGDKLWEALYAGLFRKHTYGTQTTLGSVEHLKNPSLRALKKYYKDRYVPNNMAICMSGDFDPDVVIEQIDRYFGQMVKSEVTSFEPPVEDEITQPIVKEVLGPDAENMMLGFVLPGANTHEADLLTIMDMILSNASAGLIDLNLNQAQKVLYSGTYADIGKDYAAHIFYGAPKSGQSLEQVKDLLLGQIELIKKGEFPDWLIPAIINDMKMAEIRKQERNNSRTFAMVNAFILETPWNEEVRNIEILEKISKQDIIDFANKYYGNNYVVAYKRTGTDPSVSKVVKPPITPVVVNREEESRFLGKIRDMKVHEIEPVFLDYSQDVGITSIWDGMELLYKKNKENELFQLYYVLDMGTNHDKRLKLAVDYLPYLGTSKLSAPQVQEEFYRLGCNTGVYASEDRIWISLTGLSENMAAALDLLEEVIRDAKPDDAALKNLVSDVLKQRADDKLSKDVILWSALYNYGIYGGNSPFTNILSQKELKALQPEVLTGLLSKLCTYPHRILYYGPLSQDEVAVMISAKHRIPEKFTAIPAPRVFPQSENQENVVYVVDYDMKQVEIMMLSRSELFNAGNLPLRRVFNEYFGGGMGSIVFQELRESKALAYSAFATYTSPASPDRHHYIFSYIGTQIDKLPEAMSGMSGLINQMPESDKSFQMAKDAVIAQVRSERTTKSDVLFSYLNALKMGFKRDMNIDVFEQVPGMNFSDLKKFQESYLANRKFNIMILGKKKELDTKTLSQYGKIVYLKLEDIFGY